jgi:muramoyltetrapeptide carboxypeptidase
MKKPPFLKPGDTIGICCPAGYMSAEKADQCIRTLKSWGFRVKKGKTIGGKSNTYFAGTDEERLKDLQLMLDDKQINAILFGRGGYGTSRIIDQIDWTSFKKHPKWIIGFSDITILLTHLHEHLNTQCIHGPMAGAFNLQNGKSKYVRTLKDTLEGKPTIYLSKPDKHNLFGKAKGKLVGGNLCLLAHGMGTPSELDTKDKILFIEDIGEQLYNIDRMLLQMKRAGKLKQLKGLIVGAFTDSKDTERSFGKNVYEIISAAFEEYDYPKAFGFPIGHDKENVAIIVGGKYNLVVDKDGVVLSSI